MNLGLPKSGGASETNIKHFRAEYHALKSETKSGTTYFITYKLALQVRIIVLLSPRAVVYTR